MKNLKKPDRIIITGPESSGKTTLANMLGEILHLPVTPEYALDFLSMTSGRYTFDDLKKIAVGQNELEENALFKYGPPIICDTSMLILKIWSEVRFGRSDKLIQKFLERRAYDYFLLCKPDIRWEPGPFRENPNDRDALFELYLQNLNSGGYRWGLIEGDNRLQLGLDHLDKMGLDRVKRN